MRNASYQIERDVAGEPLVIRDIGPWETFPTVTNAAEETVLELVARGKLAPGRRLFYIDSEGDTDEILVSAGRFAGFRPGPRRVSDMP